MRAATACPACTPTCPALTNAAAMRALAASSAAPQRVGAHGPPLYVLQSDFEHYGDNLPVGPDAAAVAHPA